MGFEAWTRIFQEKHHDCIFRRFAVYWQRELPRHRGDGADACGAGIGCGVSASPVCGGIGRITFLFCIVEGTYAVEIYN